MHLAVDELQRGLIRLPIQAERFHQGMNEGVAHPCLFVVISGVAQQDALKCRNRPTCDFIGQPLEEWIAEGVGAVIFTAGIEPQRFFWERAAASPVDAEAKILRKHAPTIGRKEFKTQWVFGGE